MPRYFSLEEANGLLPVLREMMTRIQDKKRTLDSYQEQLLAMVQRAAGNGRAQEPEANRLRQTAEQITDEINGLIDDVQALGCEVKDVDVGLVDFRTIRDGREVYLCWRLGEETIAFWHDLDVGFAGRQPL
jgi:hypothetical protein